MATAQELLDQAKSQLGQIQQTKDKMFANKQDNVIPAQIVDNPPTNTQIAPPPVDTALVNQSTQLATSYLNEQQKAAQSQQQQYDATTLQMRDYMSQLLGKGSERQSLLEQANIPQDRAALDRQLSRIRFKSDAILNADDKAFMDQAQLEGQGQDTRLVNRNQAAIARDRAIQRTAEASELRTAIASADLLQGDIENAVANIDAALSAKYDPIQQALQYEQFFLTQQKDFLTAAQKNEADARIQLLNTQQKILDDAQAAVSQAVASGGLQPGEIEQLMKLPPQEQIMAAQSVIGRVTQEDRAYQRAAQAASIRASNASAALSEQKLLDEQAKQEAMQQAIESGAVVLDGDQQDRAMKISKEFENESAEFKQQVGAYNRIIASASDPSAAGDLALIFNYMKMLDPGSVVREGEFATAQNSGGIPATIRARYNQVLNGERLSDGIRTDFVDRSTKLYNTALDQQMSLEDRFRDQAMYLYNLPENAADLIVQDVRAVGSVSQVALQAQVGNLSPEQRADLEAEGLLPAQPTQPLQEKSSTFQAFPWSNYR